MTSGSDTAYLARPGQFSEPEWQRLELGSYHLDIPAWVEIASTSAGPVLELGAGAGRVTFPLLDEGRQVIAVEANDKLADQLSLDASVRGYRLRVMRSRIEEIDRIEPTPAVVIAPMQLIHYLDPGDLPAVFVRLGDAALPLPDLAISLLRDHMLLEGELAPADLPQMRDQDGWVFSSRIARVDCGSERLNLIRRRESVSPKGEVWSEEVSETLWRLPAKRLIDSLRSIGYELSRSDPLPTEEGAVPADLLVFTSQRSKGQR